MPNVRKLVAILLVALGVVALAYRSFSVTDRSRTADLGPVEIRVKRNVSVPVWAGVTLVALGTALLLVDRRK